MIDVKNYLDSTYLKTSAQSGLSDEETKQKVYELVDEAISEGFYEVMIRPDFVKEIKDYITDKNSGVKVGTVIGFHEGTYSVEEKLKEAQKAIEDGVDELDFVINFEAFKRGETDYVKNEFISCTTLALNNGKPAKWIIEVAALNDDQIAEITSLIRDWTEDNFAEKESQVFVKSSTGFYKTEGGKPNGATPEAIKIMLANSGKLPVKAAGGVRTPQEALDMIALGVKRIGTSSAKALAGKEVSSDSGY